MSEAKTVRVGIIGAGKIAHVHAKYYKQIPGVEIANGVRLLVERAIDTARVQHERGRQSADPAADNDDLHGSTLALRPIRS